MKVPKCPICKKRTVLVLGFEMYPHRSDLAEKKFYWCKEHDARVGCHPNTEIPLGIPATAALRQLRSKVHRLFDPLWQENHFDSRSLAYKWLSKSMYLRANKTHVGMFTEAQCLVAIDILESKWKQISEAAHEEQVSQKWKPKESLFGA